MKTTRVNINGGASTVDVPASIPAHFVKIEEDSATPSKSLVAQIRQPNGTFSDEVTFGPGVPIKIRTRGGIIAMPPGFVASGVPAVGGTYAKIRTADASSIYVRVTEHEDFPGGDA